MASERRTEELRQELKELKDAQPKTFLNTQAVADAINLLIEAYVDIDVDEDGLIKGFQMELTILRKMLTTSVPHSKEEVAKELGLQEVKVYRFVYPQYLRPISLAMGRQYRSRIRLR